MDDSLLPALAAGAGAFGHCLGMCGGFALHLAGAEPGAPARSAISRQVFWNAGRIFTYVFLGALAGAAGSMVLPWLSLHGIQNVMAWLIGAFMIVMALAVLGLAPVRRGGDSPSLLTPVLKPFMASRAPAGAFVLGIVTGFLPCPIVLAFLADSAGRGSPLRGMATMAALGLGTTWSLLAVGIGAKWIGVRVRRWGTVVSAIILLLLGAVTIVRGTPLHHYLPGCCDARSSGASSQSAGCPHCGSTATRPNADHPSSASVP